MRGFHAIAGVLLVAAGMASGCAKDKDKRVASEWSKDSDSAKATSPKDAPHPRISPKTHMAAGKMLEHQGDMPRAIEQYQRALSADPTLTAAYNRLGIVHQRLGRFDEAESFFKRGIDASPTSPMLHNNLGFCYLQQQRYAEAERAFRSALSLAADYGRARTNLGITLARTHRLSDSVAEFSRVVPREAAFCNVAVLCEDMNEYDQAEQALRSALEANPDYAPAKEHLQRVAGLARAAAENTGTRPPDGTPTAEAVTTVPLAGSADDEGPAAP